MVQSSIILRRSVQAASTSGTLPTWMTSPLSRVKVAVTLRVLMFAHLVEENTYGINTTRSLSKRLLSILQCSRSQMYASRLPASVRLLRLFFVLAPPRCLFELICTVAWHVGYDTSCMCRHAF